MATFIRRVEKDFYLRALYHEKLPLTYMHNREEYRLAVAAPPKEHIHFLPDRPVARLGPRQRMTLMFRYRGHIIKFTAAVVAVSSGVIVAQSPEFLARDLSRSFARVSCPPGLTARFSLETERYALGYPRTPRYEEAGLPDFVNAVSAVTPARHRDLSGLTQELFAWTEGAADGYHVTVFKKGAALDGLEERALAGTGKILYLRPDRGGLPKTDSSPRQRLVTEKMFLQYLERAGFPAGRLGDALYRFLQAKSGEGTASEAWVPILFQEYMIGHIRVWTKKGGAPPLNYAAIEVIYSFAKTVAFSLKAQGYFDPYLVEVGPLENLVVDISASGLFFAYRGPSAAPLLYPGVRLLASLETPGRTITTGARVVRHIRAGGVSCAGCQFTDLGVRDRNFLFKYIYGRPFSPIMDEAPFLVGQA
jgi:hypothetical protein